MRGRKVRDGFARRRRRGRARVVAGRLLRVSGLPGRRSGRVAAAQRREPGQGPRAGPRPSAAPRPDPGPPVARTGRENRLEQPPPSAALRPTRVRARRVEELRPLPGARGRHGLTVPRRTPVGGRRGVRASRSPPRARPRRLPGRHRTLRGGAVARRRRRRSGRTRAGTPCARATWRCWWTSPRCTRSGGSPIRPWRRWGGCWPRRPPARRRTWPRCACTRRAETGPAP